MFRIKWNGDERLQSFSLFLKQFFRDEGGWNAYSLYDERKYMKEQETNKSLPIENLIPDLSDIDEARRALVVSEIFARKY